MRLPLVHIAEVPEAKVVDYLLNVEHEDGRGKAIFFKKFGFRAQAWEVLAQALKRHAELNDVAATVVTEFGVKYIVEGKLQAPGGETPNMRVVWFVETSSKGPRLVTAHALARSKE